MRRRYAPAALALVLVLCLNGCSGLWPFRGSSEGGIKAPAGATEYSCNGGKRLWVRFGADGKSAWVILPDREFRLDKRGEQYTNGISTLSVQGDQAQLDSDGGRQFSDCKRKSA